jgi:hypothetical protein
VLPRKPPFSVCHQVSTITAWPLPTDWWYQRHTSGSIGSPTVVMCLKRVSYLAGSSGPSLRSMRMVVGAVWKMVTPSRSAILHRRPASGYVGTPSYITLVVPSARGPYTMYEWPVIQPMSAAHQ